MDRNLPQTRGGAHPDRGNRHRTRSTHARPRPVRRWPAGTGTPMRPPARVWHGVDATPELTSLIREWLTRSSAPPQRPRTLLDVLDEQAPMAKENHGRSWQDRPLTND